VLAACSTNVDGAPKRPQAAGLEAFLPTADQVGRAVGNPIDRSGPAKVGSIDLLPNGLRDSNDVSPLDCLGAATPLMRVVYQKGGVTGVALQDFSRLGAGLAVSSVHTGVVRFDSDAEAARMFAAFVAQWRACSGTAVSVHVTPTASLQWRIADVRESGGTLSATVYSAESNDKPAFPTEHALGLADDCIVDVDVAVTAGLPEGRAAQLVGMMLQQVSRGR
jgi:hypothetical protein